MECLVKEEENFVYINMSLAEARELRYYLENLDIFNGKQIVYLKLMKNEKVVKAQGMVYTYEVDNMLFQSVIVKKSKSLEILTMVEKILEHKDFYSVDKVHLNEKNIKIYSHVENEQDTVKMVRRLKDDNIM